jgi:hypothetical protein
MLESIGRFGRTLILAAAVPAVASAQHSRVRPSLTLSMQSQEVDGNARPGLGTAAGVLLEGPANLGWQLELGYGGFFSRGAPQVCNLAGPECSDAGGFYHLLMTSASVAWPGTAHPGRPFVSLGATAFHGIDNPARREKNAVLPDVGLGVTVTPSMYMEARYRWRRDWEGWSFSHVALGFGWRRQ